MKTFKSISSLLFALLCFVILFSCSKTEDDSSGLAEPTKVYFYSVVSTPTASESITLKNNSGVRQDLSSWTIGDKNDPNAYNIPNGTILIQGETKTFPKSTLGFQINDKDEILYLKDSNSNTVDTWTN